MKVLVSGWFSFVNMGTTAGDLISCNLVCKWLKKADISFVVASKQSTLDGVDWEEQDPADYSHVIFICGPFGNGWPVTEFTDYFKRSKLVGLNLSMLQSLSEWNPFDLLIERDSDVASHPDMTFGDTLQKVPVVGIIKAHNQKEYGSLAMHEAANEMIDRLVGSVEVATIQIDTAMENNKYGLRSFREIESLIAKTDLVITTRLHGMVLSLKNGIPAISIDPILGGAKITKQAKTIDWPQYYQVDKLSDENLKKAYLTCIDPGIKETVKRSADIGRLSALKIEELLKKYFKMAPILNDAYGKK